ncbi:hypothetical protein BDV32DRAFT_18002 [Aspergillus pseudonomiae]|nr:hypothetical protein BDV32DRAFT_18002 [Aspergillus pseudonomiae]
MSNSYLLKGLIVGLWLFFLGADFLAETLAAWRVVGKYNRVVCVKDLDRRILDAYFRWSRIGITYGGYL